MLKYGYRGYRVHYIGPDRCLVYRPGQPDQVAYVAEGFFEAAAWIDGDCPKLGID